MTPVFPSYKHEEAVPDAELSRIEQETMGKMQPLIAGFFYFLGCGFEAGWFRGEDSRKISYWSLLWPEGKLVCNP